MSEFDGKLISAFIGDFMEKVGTEPTYGEVALFQHKLDKDKFKILEEKLIIEEFHAKAKSDQLEKSLDLLEDLDAVLSSALTGGHHDLIVRVKDLLKESGRK